MKSGISLTELVIVVAVVAILGAVSFIVIDPAARINQTQDNTRYQAVNDIMDAFLRSTVAHNNTYPAGVAADGSSHMVATSSDTCTITCSYVVDACTDFSSLVTDGYLKELPKDPDGTSLYGKPQGGTGYVVSVNKDGLVTVGACGAETKIVEITK